MEVSMKKLLVLALVFASQSAMAGDAGCGLGSMGTSGCSASGLVMQDKQIQYFVEINQQELSREMAQGHGEKLATLALLKGCSSQASQNAFAGFTQSSYSRILPAANTSAVDMVQNLNVEMGSQAELAQICHGS
jgi:hypothetical protein